MVEKPGLVHWNELVLGGGKVLDYSALATSLQWCKRKGLLAKTVLLDGDD